VISHSECDLSFCSGHAGAVVMPLIRRTRKLLTEIGAQVASSAELAQPALLGDWFANLIRIERRKCVIFTSERTLLTFLVVGPGRAAIRDYATLFRSGLRRLLEMKGSQRSTSIGSWGSTSK
jgi:hypothetical protein